MLNSSVFLDLGSRQNSGTFTTILSFSQNGQNCAFLSFSSFDFTIPGIVVLFLKRYEMSRPLFSPSFLEVPISVTVLTVLTVLDIPGRREGSPRQF